MIKKLVLPLLLCLLLTGCTVSMLQDNNTTSNISETSTEDETEETESTEPTAKPVISLDSLSAQKVIWGPGKIENHQQPTEPLNLQKKYEALDALWLLPEEKSICLTFDEGYENGFTPSILDTLKEKNVKAVFFVTYDFARDNGDLIERMIAEGHTVGNHSYHHYSMDELDTDTAKEEVLFLHRYLEENFHYTMRYFRFPKGEFSEKTLAILQELNYQSVFWSYAYADWDVNAQQEPDKAFAAICEATHPGEIMLLHAVSETNAAILGKVIDDVRQQGYEFTDSL